VHGRLELLRWKIKVHLSEEFAGPGGRVALTRWVLELRRLPGGTGALAPGCSKEL
jgi:hypothetical protein